MKKIITLDGHSYRLVDDCKTELKEKKVIWAPVTFGVPWVDTMTDKGFLISTLFFMIPIIGQALWVFYLIESFNARRVEFIIPRTTKKGESK